MRERDVDAQVHIISTRTPLPNAIAAWNSRIANPKVYISLIPKSQATPKPQGLKPPADSVNPPLPDAIASWNSRIVSGSFIIWLDSACIAAPLSLLLYETPLAQCRCIIGSCVSSGRRAPALHPTL